MSSVIKRTASPLYPPPKRISLGSSTTAAGTTASAQNTLEFSITYLAACTQPLCQCKQFIQMIRNNRNVDRYERFEFLELYTKFFLHDQHYFIPIKCFVNTLSNLLTSPSDSDKDFAITILLSILHPALIQSHQFLTLLRANKIFESLALNVINRSDKEILQQELKILFWYSSFFSLSSDNRGEFERFPELISIIIDNIDNFQNIYTLKILENLTRHSRFHIEHTRLLDILTKNIVLTLHLLALSNSYHQSNAAVFINCMQYRKNRVRAIQGGSIELFLTVFSTSRGWNDVCFDLIELVIEERIDESIEEGEVNDQLKNILVRNKHLCLSSWLLSEHTRLRSELLLRRLGIHP